jgi:hypothetical protein
MQQKSQGIFSLVDLHYRTVKGCFSCWKQIAQIETWPYTKNREPGWIKWELCKIYAFLFLKSLLKIINWSSKAKQ